MLVLIVFGFMPIYVQMEVQNPQHGQVVEISIDNHPGEEKRIIGSRICREAPCGFSDVGTTSKDAKERSANTYHYSPSTLSSQYEVQMQF